MQELLSGAQSICIYIVLLAGIMLIARILFRIPDELFRKSLHFILLYIKSSYLSIVLVRIFIFVSKKALF